MYDVTTKTLEPLRSQGNGDKRNPYQGRWNWWYSAIADDMIRNPQSSLGDIAKRLGKHPSTISMIVNTDMFKEYLAQRKDAWRQDHDHALRAKLTDVALKSLDIVLEQIETKKSAIPLKAAQGLVESTLDRLGYAPSSGPQVVVNNNTDNRQQTIGVSPADLEAARAAMRASEMAKRGTSLLDGNAGHAEAVLEARVEDSDAGVSDVPDSQTVVEPSR